MRGYTGIHFKSEALILLAENPLRGASIEINKELNQFAFNYDLANYSFHRHGVLSLDDLPEIEAAIRFNKPRQTAWDEYRSYLPIHREKYRQLEIERGSTIDKEIAGAGFNPDLQYSGQSKETVEQIIKRVNAEFEQKFDALRTKIREYSVKAEVGPTVFNFHYPHYFKNVAERVAAITPVTKEQEEQLYRPSPEWSQEWDDFRIENNWHHGWHVAAINAMRVSSSMGIFHNEDSVMKSSLPTHLCKDRRTFREGVFPGGQLDRVLDFHNRMAYKRAAEHFYTGPIPKADGTFDGNAEEDQVDAPAPGMSS